MERLVFSGHSSRESEADVHLNKAFFSYTECTVKMTRRNTKNGVAKPLSLFHTSKCQVRLCAGKAVNLGYNEKVHVSYLFIQRCSLPFLHVNAHFLEKKSRVKGLQKYGILL